MTEFLKITLGILSGFRKSLMALFLLGLGSFLLVRGYIDGAQYVDLMKDVMIAYISLAGVESVTPAVAGWMATKATKDIDGVDDALQQDVDK